MRNGGNVSHERGAYESGKRVFVVWKVHITSSQENSDLSGPYLNRISPPNWHTISLILILPIHHIPRYRKCAPNSVI